MPVDMSRYPAHWPAIVAQVRARSGDYCEWCGVKNHAWGWRDDAGYFHALEPEIFRASGFKPPFKVQLTRGTVKVIEIVLTTAHLGVPYPDGRPGNKHDKMDVRLENLAHLCQRCHLNYDRDEHRQNAAQTRRARKLKAGQLEMF